MEKSVFAAAWVSIALLAAVSIATAAQAIGQDTEKVIYLDAGGLVDYVPLTRHRSFFENDLRIYCYRGNAKTLGRLFESVELQLEIADDDYTQYEGMTPAEVRKHYNEQRSLFSFSLFSQKRARLQLSPFAQQCIGIETVQPYKLRLQHVRVDFWRVIQLAVGVALFSYAGQLSHNPLFYYIAGILLGICSSFMLLIWLSSKLVPRRTVMYGVLIGGWTIGIYVIQMLWENLQIIVLTYRTYVFWYILVTGLVSFFFCYRLGAPKNQRSKNIVKWVLQLLAILLVYFTSQFEEATAAIIIITVVLHYFPRRFIYKSRAWYLRRFPPKRRLLTNEEYYEQGVRETTKALEQLRTFASSPDCKQWKVMSKLSNPMRFAAFVEGASHLRDEEILRFEGAKYDDELNDESDLSVDEDEQQLEYEQRGGTAAYPLHRSQRGLQLNQQRSGYLARDDMSEDEAADDQDDVIEVATTANSSYRNRQYTPTRSSAPRYVPTSGNSFLRASPLQQQPQLTPSRATRMVTTAKRRSSSRHNSLQRTLNMHEYNDERVAY